MYHYNHASSATNHLDLSSSVLITAKNQLRVYSTTDDNERYVGESSPGHLEDQKGETAGRSSSSGSSSSDSGSSSSGKCSPILHIS